MIYGKLCEKAGNGVMSSKWSRESVVLWLLRHYLIPRNWMWFPRSYPKHFFSSYLDDQVSGVIVGEVDT